MSAEVDGKRLPTLIAYRASIAVCAVAAMFSIVAAAVTYPHLLAVPILAGPPIIAYLTVAGFAYICRAHLAGSIVVTTAACAVAAIGVRISMYEQPEGYWEPFILYWMMAQALVALFGGYLGYACVEWSRQRNRYSSSWSGVIIVLAILAAGGLVMAINYVLSVR